ncbi:hypothetical protein SCUP234_09689 [Seiridium cupressi]
MANQGPPKISDKTSTGAVCYLNHGAEDVASARPIINVPEDMQYSLSRFASRLDHSAEDSALRDPLGFRSQSTTQSSRERMLALMAALTTSLPSQPN